MPELYWWAIAVLLAGGVVGYLLGRLKSVGALAELAVQLFHEPAQGPTGRRRWPVLRTGPLLLEDPERVLDVGQAATHDLPYRASRRDGRRET